MVSRNGAGFGRAKFGARTGLKKHPVPLCGVIVANIAAVAAVSAFAAPPRKAVHSQPSARCTTLEADYEDASKDLAASFAEGLGDNSAVRETMRATQDNNVISKARITADLLRQNGCRQPTAAPSANRYVIPAMQCQNDLLAARLEEIKTGTASTTEPASCDRTKWAPRKGS